MWPYHRVMSPNDAEGMVNSVDPNQTPLGAVWSGSALFAQTRLSENLGSLRYSGRKHLTGESLTYVCTFLYSVAWFRLNYTWVVGWLCWGLTSQSTIFQSCRDGAIASWVINQYFRGVKCLAQGHNTAAVGLEPWTSRSGVRHSTTEPPRSPPECIIMTFHRHLTARAYLIYHFIFTSLYGTKHCVHIRRSRI